MKAKARLQPPWPQSSSRGVAMDAIDYAVCILAAIYAACLVYSTLTTKDNHHDRKN